MPHRLGRALAIIGLASAVAAIPVPAGASPPAAAVTTAPVVRSIEPAFGPMTGNTMVTITGANFTSGSTVSFGSYGNPLGSAVKVDPSGTSLTVMAPPAPLGPVPVTVTTPAGSSGRSLRSLYVYVPTPGLVQFRPGWIAKGDALEGFDELSPSVTKEFFDNPGAYVVVSDYGSACPVSDPIDPPPGTIPQPCTDDPLPRGVSRAVPTAAFASYAKMKAVLDAGALPPGIKAVLYDPESWPFTPMDEQLDPADYARSVAGLAHAHGLTFVDTPAQDLVVTLGKLPGESNSQAYLRYGLAASAARYADVVDFQLQGSELNYVNYRQILASFVAQARSTGSHAVLYAGLATNPSGQVVTPEQVYQAAIEAQPLVSGYWLNDAFQSTDCPKCTGPYPQKAIDLLGHLARYGR